MGVRRRKYVINKGLQYRFILLCFGYVAAFLVVLSLALFIPLAVQMETIDLDLDGYLRAADRFVYLHGVFWPVAIVCLLAISLHAVYISHKLVGPLYRHELTFAEIKDGKLPKPIRLRKGDYLRRETEIINAMLETLRSRTSELQEEHAQLSYLIYRLGGTLPSPPNPETTDALLALSEKEKEIIARLNSIKID